MYAIETFLDVTIALKKYLIPLFGYSNCFAESIAAENRQTQRLVYTSRG